MGDTDCGRKVPVEEDAGDQGGSLLGELSCSLLLEGRGHIGITDNFGDLVGDLFSGGRLWMFGVKGRPSAPELVDGLLMAASGCSGVKGWPGFALAAGLVHVEGVLRAGSGLVLEGRAMGGGALGETLGGGGGALGGGTLGGGGAALGGGTLGGGGVALGGGTLGGGGGALG